MASIPESKVLIFSSPGCAPCRQLKPNMVKLQASYGFDMEIIELSDDTRARFTEQDVRATPTVIGLDANGDRLGIFVGAQSPAILENHLRKWGVI